MSYKIRCSCGQALNLQEELIGKTIRCPKCNTTLKIKPKAQPAEVIMEADLVQTEPSAAASPDAMHSSLPASSPSAASFEPEAGETNHAPPVNTQARLTVVSAFLGIAVGGLMLLGAGLFLTARSLGSYSWETTQGTITQSVVTSGIQGSTRFRTRGVPSNQTKQRINVEYEYEVEGKTFTNDRISFRFNEGNNIETLNALVLKYSKQSTVPVHYKPSNPGVSVLEPGIPGLAWIFLIIGILLIVACRFGLPHLRAFIRRTAKA